MNQKKLFHEIRNFLLLWLGVFCFEIDSPFSSPTLGRQSKSTPNDLLHLFFGPPFFQEKTFQFLKLGLRTYFQNEREFFESLSFGEEGNLLTKITPSSFLLSLL